MSAHLDGRYQQASETPTAQPAVVRIASPGGGEALQGVVSVRGAGDAPGFRAAEVSFAYQNNPTGTWFLIQQISAPVNDGPLASWDTTTIADGTYRLRLQVFLTDGRTLESEITGLRVRNYSPVETGTPGHTGGAGQTGISVTGTPSITPTRPDFQVTPRGVTPQPTNPIQVTREDLQSSATQGVAIVIGILAVFGMYLGLRAFSRR